MMEVKDMAAALIPNRHPEGQGQGGELWAFWNIEGALGRLSPSAPAAHIAETLAVPHQPGSLLSGLWLYPCVFPW
jgi:hypothetical protein